MNNDVTIPAWLQQSPVSTSIRHESKWIDELRQTHWSGFKKYGLPTKQNERWKYTDLSFLGNKKFTLAPQIKDDSLRYLIDQHRLKQGNSILLVFVNGYFTPQFSDMNKLFPGLIACSINQAFKDHPALIRKYWPHQFNAQQHPFASLNAAIFSDGLFFYLPKQYELSMPVHLLSVATHEQAFISHPHHLIVLSEESKLTFVEEFIALNSSKDYIMNTVFRVLVGQDAKLEYIKIQNESTQAIHLAHMLVKQMQDSKITLTNFSSGSQFARDDLVVKLVQPGAQCKATGFYHLREDNQCIDHHIDIDHLAAHSQSEMLYKGILEKKSRLIFNGKLHVYKNAQKILAHQANHNILLSADAEVYSKPELEIYADDVKCKHGATTGQLDQEALFYLRSRGIPHSEAMTILLQAFAEEILEEVIYSGIKQHVKKMV